MVKIKIYVSVAIVAVAYLIALLWVWREQVDDRKNFAACPLCGEEGEK
jgi:hypothetical protein